MAPVSQCNFRDFPLRERLWKKSNRCEQPDNSDLPYLNLI